MVSVGLCSVFELLRETQATQPVLCHRALLALLNILQAQSPEGLRSEPADIVGTSRRVFCSSTLARHGCLIITAALWNRAGHYIFAL